MQTQAAIVDPTAPTMHVRANALSEPNDFAASPARIPSAAAQAMQTTTKRRHLPLRWHTHPQTKAVPQVAVAIIQSTAARLSNVDAMDIIMPRIPGEANGCMDGDAATSILHCRVA